ncbi:hypothetical protein MKX83_17380 [Cytobacillus sp. FSL M8-0252]|uniref:hypothetical protein n=1 Tax=Cytobacillus sp. FSL M8-0252 TaxID=2921621 RepID=UPI0030F90168
MIRREDVTFIDSLSEPVIQNVAVISERVIAENEGAGSVSFTVAKESIAQGVNVDSLAVVEESKAVDYGRDLLINLILGGK